ncbi:alpha-D-ribose 1-methylphosphonate 5-triphosphate diphosphatase [Halorubrum sp. HHNYT27]|uniref:alpha-D-ribose 1-methylphosphonate 5-triphosphate diphosphatase n=1 Tax=Halorubrum sp. HHNYT27 TaxID=3402275 RepID=UPI003EBFD96D
MTRFIEIRNGRVVTPSCVIEDGRVVIAGERIVRIDRAAPPSTRSETVVDADGRVVMPGLVDLHGDDIEEQFAPRSGAETDPTTALATADRMNVLHGVTTKFHALAFEESPEDGRNLENAARLARAVDRGAGALGDNRVHARCELADASADAVAALIEEVDVDLVSVMHHAPGGGQYDAESFERHYVEDRNWPAEAARSAAEERSGMDDASQGQRIDRIGELARRVGVPLASHDDKGRDDVETMAAHGAAISEYPLTLDAARRAKALGLATVMGAPNLVRGGSLWDNLSARKAIEAGVLDALCSDYHPASLLAAPFVDTGESLSTRVNRVTRNPADIAGLPDRGRIEVGARADLVIVDPSPTPTVERAFVAGSEVIRASAGSGAAPELPARSRTR